MLRSFLPCLDICRVFPVDLPLDTKKSVKFDSTELQLKTQNKIEYRLKTNNASTHVDSAGCSSQPCASVSDLCTLAYVMKMDIKYSGEAYRQPTCSSRRVAVSKDSILSLDHLVRARDVGTQGLHK